MSLTNLLFGSTSKNAKREAETYDPSEGGRQKDLGDYLGDFFTGQGAVLDKATKQQYISNLEEKYGDDISDLNKYGLSNVKITGDTKKTDLARLIRKYKDDVVNNKAVDQAAAVAGYTPVEGATYQQKLVGLSKYNDSKVGSPTETALYNRGITEKNSVLDNRRQDFTEAQAQRETAYNNRVLDMKDAREARNARDKQLMMIIQGLNSFGQGFQ